MLTSNNSWFQAELRGNSKPRLHHPGVGCREPVFQMHHSLSCPDVSITGVGGASAQTLLGVTESARAASEKENTHLLLQIFQ